MDLKFTELRCPCCKAAMEQGNVHMGVDVQMVKRCTDCEFWMIMVIPNKLYDYKVTRTIKKEEVVD